MSRDPKKLQVFPLADGLAIVVYRLTARLPRHEQFGPTAQLRRAAVSIPTNIVVDWMLRRTESPWRSA
jgi:hypothetical protein